MSCASGLWRAWIAALLLLSLPLQGLAAACMLGCGQGSALAAQAASAQGHHGHAMDTADGVDSAVQLGETGIHGHQHGGHGGSGHAADSASSESDGSCSACAACFVGAGMPAGESGFSAQAPTQAVHSAHAPALADTCPDGLERPPRNVGA